AAGLPHSAMVLNEQIVGRDVVSARMVARLQAMTATCEAPNLANALFSPATMPSVSAVRYCAGLRAIGSPVASATLPDVQRRDPRDSDETLRAAFASLVRITPTEQP